MPSTTNFLVSYTDLHSDGAGYTERYIPGSAEAVRTCQVEWAEKGLFVAAMLGYSQVGAGNKIRRFLPESHPEADWFYAVEAELLRGVGAPGQGGSSSFLSYGTSTGLTDGYAHILIRYRPLMYDVVEDALSDSLELARFVERSRTYTIESLQVSPGAWEWTSDDDPYHDYVTKLMGTEELTYIWHDVPRVPSTLTNVVGKLNDAAFDAFAPDGPYETGTLLCMPPQVERTTNAFGNTTYRLTYKFLRRDPSGDGTATWNHFYRPDTGLFDKLRLISDNNVFPYASANFNSLFSIA